jgi:hypothetical protein
MESNDNDEFMCLSSDEEDGKQMMGHTLNPHYTSSGSKRWTALLLPLTYERRQTKYEEVPRSSIQYPSLSLESGDAEDLEASSVEAEEGEWKFETSSGNKFLEEMADCRSILPIPLVLSFSAPIKLSNAICQPILYRLASKLGNIIAEGVIEPAEILSIHDGERIYRSQIFVSLRLLNYGWSKWTKVFTKREPYRVLKNFAEILVPPLSLSMDRMDCEIPPLIINCSQLDQMITFSCPYFIANKSGLQLNIRDTSTPSVGMPQNSGESMTSIIRRTVLERRDKGTIRDSKSSELKKFGESKGSSKDVSLIVHLPRNHLQAVEVLVPDSYSLLQVLERTLEITGYSKGETRASDYVIVEWTVGMYKLLPVTPDSDPTERKTMSWGLTSTKNKIKNEAMKSMHEVDESLPGYMQFGMNTACSEHPLSRDLIVKDLPTRTICIFHKVLWDVYIQVSNLVPIASSTKSRFRRIFSKEKCEVEYRGRFINFEGLVPFSPPKVLGVTPKLQIQVQGSSAWSTSIDVATSSPGNFKTSFLNLSDRMVSSHAEDGHIDENSEIIQPSTSEKYYNLGVLITFGEGVFHSTRTVTIVPKFVLSSHLHFGLKVQHGTSESSVVESITPEATMTFHFLSDTKNSLFRFSKEASEDEVDSDESNEWSPDKQPTGWTPYVDPRKVGVAYVRLGSISNFIKVKVELSGSSYVVSLYELEDSFPPFLFGNYTSFDFKFTQSTSDKEPVGNWETLLAGSTLPYTWDADIQGKQNVAVFRHLSSSGQFESEDELNIPLDDLGFNYTIHTEKRFPSKDTFIFGGYINKYDPRLKRWTKQYALVVPGHIYFYKTKKMSVLTSVMSLLKRSKTGWSAASVKGYSSNAKVEKEISPGDVGDNLGVTSEYGLFSFLSAVTNLSAPPESRQSIISSKSDNGLSKTLVRLLFLRISEVMNVLKDLFGASTLKECFALDPYLSADEILKRVSEVVFSSTDFKIALRFAACGLIPGTEEMLLNELLSNEYIKRTSRSPKMRTHLSLTESGLDSLVDPEMAPMVNFDDEEEDNESEHAEFHPSNDDLDSISEVAGIHSPGGYLNTASIADELFDSEPHTLKERPTISSSGLELGNNGGGDSPNTTLSSACPTRRNTMFEEAETLNFTINLPTIELSDPIPSEENAMNEMKVIIDQTEHLFSAVEDKSMGDWVCAISKATEEGWTYRIVHGEYDEANHDVFNATVNVRVTAQGRTKVMELTEEITSNTDEENESPTNSKDLKSADQDGSLQINFVTQSVNICIIDDLPLELINIKFNEIDVGLCRLHDELSLAVTCQDLLVSNQLLGSFFPNMVHPCGGNSELGSRENGSQGGSKLQLLLPGLRNRNPGEFPALHFFMEQTILPDNNRNELLKLFDVFTIWIAPLKVRADDEIVIRLYRMTNSIMKTLLGKTEKQLNSRANSNLKNARREFDKAHTAPVLKKNFLNFTNAQNVYEDTLMKGEKDDEIVYFRVFQLHPIEIFLTFKNSVDFRTGFEESFIFSSMQLDNGRVCLNALILENALGTPKFITKTIVKHYRRVFMGQIYKLLGKTDLIEGSVGLVTSLGTGVYDLFYEPIDGLLGDKGNVLTGLSKGSRSLATKTVQGTSAFTSKLFGSLGRAGAALTMDSAYQNSRARGKMMKADGISHGLKVGTREFGEALFAGLTGIVTAPIKGYRQNGGLGMGAGLAKGILGVALKPAVGFMDLASRTAEGIKNSGISSSKEDSLSKQLARFPRTFGRHGSIVLYDPIMSKLQYIVDSLLKWTRNSSSPRYVLLFYTKSSGESENDTLFSFQKHDSYYTVSNGTHVMLLGCDNLETSDNDDDGIRANILWTCHVSRILSICFTGASLMTIQLKGDVVFDHPWDGIHASVNDSVQQRFIDMRCLLDRNLGFQHSQKHKADIFGEGGQTTYAFKKPTTNIRAMVLRPILSYFRLNGNVLLEYAVEKGRKKGGPRATSIDRSSTLPEDASDTQDTGKEQNDFRRSKTEGCAEEELPSDGEDEESESSSSPSLNLTQSTAKPRGLTYIYPLCNLNVESSVVKEEVNGCGKFRVAIQRSDGKEFEVLRYSPEARRYLSCYRASLILYFSDQTEASNWHHLLTDSTLGPGETGGRSGRMLYPISANRRSYKNQAEDLEARGSVSDYHAQMVIQRQLFTPMNGASPDERSDLMQNILTLVELPSNFA